jgi:hypothetical protein
MKGAAAATAAGHLNVRGGWKMGKLLHVEMLLHIDSQCKQQQLLLPVGKTLTSSV